MSKLFDPIQIGPYQLKNRIFMAPLSRNRADSRGVLPAYAADYYGQRAEAGLIIAESVQVNDWSNGMNAPGIFNQEQIESWTKIVNEVHAQDGRIFLQLWHAGRAGHQSLMPAQREVAGPSAIAISREVVTFEGMQTATPPRALTLEEIAELRRDYRQAAVNAKAAGFDGIEISAANGYLIDQFLQDAANQRTDAYGGTAEKRSRFLMEVLDDAIDVWGAGRIGVRLSPTGDFNEIGDSDTIGTFSLLFKKLDGLGLAYMHMVEQLPWSASSEEKIAINNTLRVLWSGPFIANGGFDVASGTDFIETGKASAISFGRPWIANPDLVKRFRISAPLNMPDEATIYGGDQRGYSDYPVLQEDMV